MSRELCRANIVMIGAAVLDVVLKMSKFMPVLCTNQSNIAITGAIVGKKLVTCLQKSPVFQNSKMADCANDSEDLIESTACFIKYLDRKCDGNYWDTEVMLSSSIVNACMIEIFGVQSIGDQTHTEL